MTKQKSGWLGLIFSLYLSACVTMPQQELELATFYPYDIRIKQDNDKALRGHGFFVSPFSSKYSFKFRSYGEVHDFDLAVVETCHRHIKLEKQGTEFVFNYLPLVLERDYCPLRVTGFDEGAQVGFAFIDFEPKERSFRTMLQCNGVTSFSDHGVMLCQNKVGKVSTLITHADTIVESDPGCQIYKPREDQNKVYRIKHTPGFCVFTFLSMDGEKKARLTSYGYEKLLIRGK